MDLFLKIIGKWQVEPHSRIEASDGDDVILYECGIKILHDLLVIKIKEGVTLKTVFLFIHLIITCACYAEEITPYKFTDSLPYYEVPVSSRFAVNRSEVSETAGRPLKSCTICSLSF